MRVASAGMLALTARRVAVALTIALAVALLLLPLWWRTPRSALFARLAILAVSGTAAFSLFEVRPRRLPPWFERWVLQVLAVGISVPIAIAAMYLPTAPPSAPPFVDDHDWMLLTHTALLVAPWAAFAAIVRHKEAVARHQQLEFALERSELERQALDARLHLLQAQVAPHFLFNTLANVQALVDAGSPRASGVLRSLVRYLRASVPLLSEPAATIERELQLVRPYLELMQTRMPDRLQYSVHVDPAALKVRCPPTTVLTLVENAVRHGIDPAEEGGRIEIHIARAGDRLLVRVTDTGVGLQQSPAATGTGLAALRERLRLIFGDAAQVRLTSDLSGGVAAEVDMPAHG